MKRVIMIAQLLLILLILLGCSTHTQSDKVLAPNKENTQFNKQQASGKTHEAEMNSFSIHGRDTVLLELSTTINIEKLVAVKLLSPDEPIWNGELKEFNWGFGAYKFEVSLHDVTLNKISKEKLMFSDPHRLWWFWTRNMWKDTIRSSWLDNYYQTPMPLRGTTGE